MLTYDNGVPTCFWITPYETKTLSICLDERLFGDTILRAEKINSDYVISDVWLYNSSCIFMVTTFRQRYEWLKQMLERFHRPILTKLIHKSAMSAKIKGYEVYDAKEGSHGCFTEADEKKIIRTDIPDVYTVEGEEGYVLVPTLKMSVYLRSKPAEFMAKCVQCDGNWSVQEDLT